jgi:fructokinase
VIASLGEALIDFTPMMAGDRLEGFHVHPGGSPYNVAVAVARLGHPSAYIGKLSSDPFGDLLVRHLAESGVRLDLIRRGPQPTPLAFVGFREDEPRYDFRLEHTAAVELHPGELDADALLGLEALHFGSLVLALPPARDAVLHLAERLRGWVPLSFDPNLRPEAAPDRAGYRDAVRRSLELADLVKLSDRDLAVWGEEVRPRPAQVLIVTCGAQGSRLVIRDRELRCPAAPCQVVDTVGAGDAFTAGLLVGLAEVRALEPGRLATVPEQIWRRVARLAAATAALTCGNAGADPPRRAAVEARLSAWPP